MRQRSVSRVIRQATLLSLLFLLIEFLDEFVYGAREAAWPLLRADLGLNCTQIGQLLTIPAMVSTVVEPTLGILSDTGRRRALILGGGVAFALALALIALSRSFGVLLAGFVLFYPALGAFVSLSQATLMDLSPERREQNMARWTFAGSLGVVLGPLALGVAVGVGLGWRWRSTISAGWWRVSSRWPWGCRRSVLACKRRCGCSCLARSRCGWACRVAPNQILTHSPFDKNFINGRFSLGLAV